MRKRMIWYMFVCIYIVFASKSSLHQWTLFIFNMCGCMIMDYVIFERLMKRGRKGKSG
jgi:hypothetical protein